MRILFHQITMDFNKIQTNAKYTAKSFHNFKSKIYFEYPTVAQQVTKFFVSYANWCFITMPKIACYCYLPRDKYKTHPHIPLSAIPQALFFCRSGLLCRISDNFYAFPHLLMQSTTPFLSHLLSITQFFLWRPQVTTLLLVKLPASSP